LWTRAFEGVKYWSLVLLQLETKVGLAVVEVLVEVPLGEGAAVEEVMAERAVEVDVVTADAELLLIC
jgi:hypothetical protein